jgi:hypothetical protein
VKAKWLETKCLEADRGVEWDWMNWQRSVGVAASTERTTMTDLADIYKRACGGVSCAGLQPTPAQLIAAAKVKYGVTNLRTIAFTKALNDYGANH